MAPGANLFWGSAGTSLSGSSATYSAPLQRRRNQPTKRTTRIMREKGKRGGRQHLLPPAYLAGHHSACPQNCHHSLLARQHLQQHPHSSASASSPGIGAKGSSPPLAKAGVGFLFGSPSRTSSQTTTSTTAPGPIFGFGSRPKQCLLRREECTTGGTADSAPTSTNASTPTLAPATALLDLSSSAVPQSDTPATEGSLEEDGLA